MKNIILTGLMGSGKSSAAKELKKFLPEFDLIETDSLIVEQEMMSINEIFKTKGEKYFRETEKNIIDNLIKKDGQIISLGGGSLENNFNFDLAKETSLMFYLRANVEILYERIKNDSERPLLKCENPQKKLEELLEKREENYKKADYIIDVNSISVNEIADKIIGLYKNETGNN